MHAARFHARAGVLAVGGPEHDLALWDVEKSTPTFQARNVSNTELDLRVPVWVSAMQFLPEAGSSATTGPLSTSSARDDASPHVIALASRHRHVRLYDIRAGRRPLVSVELGEYAFTALDASADGLSILTGDSIGTLRRLDVRASLRQVCVYKGAGGCVRSLAVSAAQPYFASVGLDRCLHVHHFETRARLRRVYLKQCLTAVLFVPGAPEAAAGSRGASGMVDGGDSELAPEPPQDTRVRITYARGAALRPVATAGAASTDVENDDVWEELDRRAAAAGEPPRLAGQKHRREGASAAILDKPPASDLPVEDDDAEGLESGGEDDDDDDLGFDEEDEDDDELDDESDSGDDVDDDDDDDLDDEGGGEGHAKSSRGVSSRSGGRMVDDDDDDDEEDRGRGVAGAEEEEEDDPLVSSAAVAKSLRKEVEAVRRAEERAAGGSALAPTRAGPLRRSGSASGGGAQAAAKVPSASGQRSGPKRK